MLQYNPELLIKQASKDLLKRIPKNKNKAYADTLLNALKAFIKGDVGVFGAYVATKNALVYRTIDNDRAKQEVLIMRLVNGGVVTYFGNSSRMQYEGSTMAFGHRSRVWGLSPSQKICEAMGVPQLPFNALTEAGLKLVDIQIVDHTGAETVNRRDRQVKNVWKYREVHFTGALLFKTGTEYFLMDIDREEIKHGIFNPFIVNIPKPALTVAEAYDSLMPDVVRQAIAKGIEVLRQGEHFFIKQTEANAYKPDTEHNRWSEKTEQVQARLSAQGNRDHVCSAFNKASGLVSGYVVHQGREHKDLDLTKGWYMPVPNTAVKSFTIVGDID